MSLRIWLAQGATRTWIDRALCRDVDPETFFPGPHEREKLADAKRICRDCPVQAECLDYALEAGERYGVWGGTSERERRRIWSRRAREAAA